MLKFSTEHLDNIFTKYDYEATKNLMFDLACGNEIIDENDNRVISRKEANDTLRNITFDILGITNKSSKKERKRALKRHGIELFEVLEEVIDMQISTGFKDSEFFNEFVDERNLSDGDSQEFWTNDEVILSVAKVSGDHHDLILQRLGEGESYTVPTSTYAVAVGTDIDLYLSGRRDFNELTTAVAKAFLVKIQNDMYSEVMNAGSKLPVSDQFVKTMALSSATKETFDQLLEDVQTANDNAPVYIMGTKTALKKLTALADVDWASDSQKNSIAELGRLGSYEGTAIIEIPQRFAPNDVTKKLVANDKLLIMPQVDNKFVKFVNIGDTEILEVTEKGEKMNDLMEYEVQRTMGIGTQIGRYFGVWTITD